MKKPLLIKEFLKDKKIASIKSSSKFLVNYICKKIDFGKDIVIIEYGPGTGVLTKEILNRMSIESKLISIETNAKLSLSLKDIKDSRLTVINDSAENVKNLMRDFNLDKADYIISGIPFSMIKHPVKDKILFDTKHVMDDNGVFLVYQFRKDIEKNLRRHFSSVNRHLEVRNIPPLFVFEVRK